MQSARGVRSPGRGLAGRPEVLLEWSRAVGLELGAWRAWGAAARGGERVRPPLLGAHAGAPSSPSLGCRAGCPAGRGKCGAAVACGDDASAGRRRGCARWGRPNRGRASGCCAWSTPIRYRCRSESQPRQLLHPHQRGISPLRPLCCQDLCCCDVCRPRFSWSRCFGSLWSEKENTVKEKVNGKTRFNALTGNYVRDISDERYIFLRHLIVACPHLHCAGCRCFQERSCSWWAHGTEAAGWRRDVQCRADKERCASWATGTPQGAAGGPACLGLRPHWSRRCHSVTGWPCLCGRCGGDEWQNDKRCTRGTLSIILLVCF